MLQLPEKDMTERFFEIQLVLSDGESQTVYKLEIEMEGDEDEGDVGKPKIDTDNSNDGTIIVDQDRIAGVEEEIELLEEDKVT